MCVALLPLPMVLGIMLGRIRLVISKQTTEILEKYEGCYYGMSRRRSLDLFSLPVVYGHWPLCYTVNIG